VAARRGTTPFISKVLPVADPDTGWKPMLHYTVVGVVVGARSKIIDDLLRVLFRSAFASI
jgi:hypothetical protein